MLEKWLISLDKCGIRVTKNYLWIFFILLVDSRRAVLL